MAVSKVVYGNQTLIDLTGDTVTADTLASGVTAHSKAGVQLTGTAVVRKYGVSIDTIFGSLNSSGILQRPSGGNVDLVLEGFQNIANSAMYYKFYRCDNLKTVTFKDLTSLTQATPLNYCFGTCVNLESVSFPSLTIIGVTTNTGVNRQFYYAFNGCTKLTELRFPELTAIYCNGTAASYGTFYGNNTIQKLYFPKLATISKASAYRNATASNNVFASMEELTEIHFASANQTSIQASTGYSSKWGATNATIYFDL